MEHVTAAGVRIPALGLGTWQLTGEDCAKAVPIALELGYTSIDTAQAYRNEGDIGAAIAESGVERQRLFLTTKVANRNHDYGDVLASVQDSLRRLRTDYLDLLLVHWPVSMDTMPQTLEAMRELQDRGLVRNLGVSNFTPGQVRLAQDHIEVVNVQVERHVYLGQPELHLLAQQQDFSLTAYSPLARGKVLHDELLIELAQAHGASPAQVALRFLLQQDRTVVVPKGTSREHLESNLASLDIVLSDEEMRRIAELERGERIVDPPFSPDW